MNPIQVLGAALILVFCPLLGVLPTPRSFSLGIAIVEGLISVGISKLFFWGQPEWDMLAIAAVAMGYFAAKKYTPLPLILAGYGLHNPIAGGFVLLFTLVGITIFRSPQQSRWIVLLAMPLMNGLLNPWNNALIITTVILSGIVFWSDQKLLNQPANSAAKATFRAFQPGGTIASLEDSLQPQKSGYRAATLAQIKRLGCPVPPGWILYPGDDLDPLAHLIRPTRQDPAIVRASTASTTFVREAVSQDDLWVAIVQGFEKNPEGTPLLIQAKLWSVFEGSVDRIDSNHVQIQVRSTGSSREIYRVTFADPDLPHWQLHPDILLRIEGSGETPVKLVQEVAVLAQYLYNHLLKLGTIEWIHDGEQLWIWDAQSD